VSLPTGEDWILRPVMNGLIKYESLLDGTLSIDDVALLNDALDVKQENEERYSEAMKD
jgi:hypothetical protein